MYKYEIPYYNGEQALLLGPALINLGTIIIL